MTRNQKTVWALLLAAILLVAWACCGCAMRHAESNQNLSRIQLDSAVRPPTPETGTRFYKAAVPQNLSIDGFQVDADTVTLSWLHPGPVTVEASADFGPWLEAGTAEGSLTIPRYADAACYRLVVKAAPAAPGTVLWVDAPATGVNDYARAVARDPSGNIVTAGDLNNGFFLRKYSGGVTAWTRTSSGTGYGYGVACDGAGNVYVTGSFAGAIDLGGGWLTGSSGIAGDTFLAKYAPNGTHLWSKAFASGGGGGGLSIAVDGAVYIGGSMAGVVDFGCGALTTGAYLAKFDLNGVCQWSKRFGDNPQSGVCGLAANSTGVWITGVFAGTANFGMGNLVSAGGGFDAFVAKYSSAGTPSFSARFGDLWVDKGYAIAVTPAGEAVMVGEFRGTVNFGGGPMTTTGTSPIDGFVVKLASNGAHLWSHQIAGSATSQDHARAVAIADGILVGGDMIGSFDFGCGSISAGGGPDAFLVKYDMAGNCLWSHAYGAISTDQVLALCDRAATGAWFGTVDFGTGSITSQGGGDAFVFGFAP